MSIKLLGKIPNKICVALSGGVDSVVAADFLDRAKTVSAAFFHHGTETSELAMQFVKSLCEKRSWVLNVGYIKGSKPKDQSQEEWWRNQRYAFLDSINMPIITAHHLDDCIETWLWSSCHGQSKVIPYRRNHVIRPFLLTEKRILINWAKNHQLAWIEDTSNKDTKFMRNRIRMEMIPIALKVNPGLAKVVARQVKNNFHQTTVK